MLRWASKTAAEVDNYRWNAGLDPGDTLASGAVTKLSGDVALDDQTRDDTGITVWLSGGTPGDTLFRAFATTTSGREIEEFITLTIVPDYAADSDDPYATPSPSDLKARYPAFAAVDDATVAYWIKDASRFADKSWIAGDYGPALLAAAAHNMSSSGLLATSDEGDLAGVSDFRSASFQVRFSDDYVKAQIAGGWESTRYGQDYLDCLRRSKGGPRVTSPGAVPYCDGFNGWAGPMGYPARLFP